MEIDDSERIHSLEVYESIDPDGEMTFGFEISEGMTFPDAVKMLEMAKLTMHEIFRDGEWDEEFD